MRLTKEQMEREAAAVKTQAKTPQQNNKFNLKKPKSISNSSMTNNNTNVRKKVDNLNTDYIKYIEDRKTGHLPKR